MTEVKSVASLSGLKTHEALRILALGTSATANGRNVSQPGKISVLLDAVPLEVGSSRHSGIPLDDE
ncbi:MAG: hypothetical protein EAZ49_30435 [Oscillatoriales cyanobacterium]|nr:MAG: hypothetical protein EAZ49_30435 [Oscillatoriales cyanobacterium]